MAGNDDDSCDRWNWGSAFADRVSNGVVALVREPSRLKLFLNQKVLTLF